MARNRRPRWYFSLRSPYSWFAYRELVEHWPGVLDAVDWVPYWEPDAGTERLLAERGTTLALTTMSRAKNFYILQDTRRWARARGWTVTWPVDREPVWEVPHLAYLCAADAGRGPAFVDLVYRARWQQGRDICARSTIAEIAAELGLAEQTAAAADGPGLRRRGVECLAEGAADGVFGVPFFVHGHDRFWGVERVALFAAAVLGQQAPVAVRDSGGPGAVTDQDAGDPAEVVEVGADGGHAGGCG